MNQVMDTVARPRTDYGLKRPAHDEVREVFGSSKHALRVTGGDIPMLCFYLANPSLAAGAARVNESAAVDSMADQLREWMGVEQRDAIVAAWNGMPPDKRSVTAVMKATHHARVTVEAALHAADIL